MESETEDYHWQTGNYGQAVDGDYAEVGSETEQEEAEELDTEPLWLAQYGPIALQVYKDVWNEFYNFETQYCESMLKSLSRGGPGSLKHDPPAVSSVSYVPSNASSSYKCEIVDYDNDESTLRVTDLHIDPTELRESDFTLPGPYSRYTTCTPIAHNRATPQYPEMHSRAQFLPHADEKKFHEKYSKYLDAFEDFAWQVDVDDPDREMIELEAARRLYCDHGYSYEDIDKFGMFKYKMCQKGRESLVWHASQRDQFRWPGGSSTLVALPNDKDDSTSNSNVNPTRNQTVPATLPISNVNPKLTLYEEVNRNIVDFCPRLSCATWFCEAHDKAPAIIPPKATVKNQRMLNGKRKPCDRECYKIVDIGDVDLPNTHWHEDERLLFQSVIEMTPDTHPCDLAVICRKPCFEMYIERMNILPDDNIQKESNTEPRPNFTFENPREKKSIGPCFHEGPCSRSNCSCFRTKQHCQRSCRCSLKCKLRRTGCKCHNKTKNKPWKPCIPKYNDDSLCPCAREAVECDPELCIGCDARCASHGKCQNMKLQKGKFTGARILPSKFGLGAFATKNMEEGEYIGEYTGEKLNGLCAERIVPLQKYASLNYAFGLLDDALDSWRAGNETRYLNDSMPFDPNCDAKVLIVDGEPRIIIQTSKKIEAGDELTLSYGNDYWKDQEGKSPNDEDEEALTDKSDSSG